MEPLSSRDVDDARRWWDSQVVNAALRASAGESPSEKKARLRTVSSSKQFHDWLFEASAAEAQALVDSGMFKVLCLNLHHTGEHVATACTIGSLVNLITKLPHLVEKAWELGAVRPVVDLIKKIVDRNKLKLPRQHKELCMDQVLLACIGFLSKFLVPLMAPSFHGNKLDLRRDDIVLLREDIESLVPLQDAPVVKVCEKFLRWLVKEGVLLRLARVMVALSQVPLSQKDAFNGQGFFEMACRASSFLSHCMQKDLQHREVAAVPGT